MFVLSVLLVVLIFKFPGLVLTLLLTLAMFYLILDILACGGLFKQMPLEKHLVRGYVKPKTTASPMVPKPRPIVVDCVLPVVLLLLFLMYVVLIP